ncbi:MAG TPA: hypothetical protein VGI76_03470 [Solirubrobacteraceae bacterium]|jgi:hypothetical protein
MGINLKRRGPRFMRLAPAAFVALLLLAVTSASALGVLPAQPSAAHKATSVKTYKLVPKVQRTVRSTGYSTYVFNAPAGRRILVANARIVGAQRHAVAIRSKAITAQLTRYTVNLVFPGEQGNPGKLVVRLVLVAG